MFRSAKYEAACTQAKLTRELFIAGKTIPEIIAHFAELGTPRTYLQCISSVHKGGISLAGRIDRERPWTPDEDQILAERLKAGLEVEQIRKILYRSAKSVRQRLAEKAMAAPEKKAAPGGRLELHEVLSRPWGAVTIEQRGTR